ncbi:MAG: 2-dehydropantoate 2-reductase, partial [Thermoanaerobaculia bacterium]
MKIGIYGTGGAGGHFGARLAKAGEDVVFIARGEHLEAIRREGLVVETDTEEIRIRPTSLKATDDPAEAGPVDVVLLGVKTWQVEEAARRLGPMLGPETFVVPLQNGVDAARQLVGVLGPERVVGGLCATFSWIVAPGRIRSLGQVHSIRFGELDRRPSARTETLRETFERAGIRATVPPDIHVSLWEKLLFVVSFGGVGAVTRVPIGVIRTVPETRRMLRSAMEEVHAVGRGRGIAMADDAVERGEAFLDGLDPTGTTSLQRDITEGRPSELEAWNGAVVRLGREAGVPTPTHEFLYA